MLTNDFGTFLSFLIGEGYSGNISQAAYEFLTTEGYSGTLQDMWFDFLTDQGYSGALPDMMKSWASDGFPYSNISFSVGEVDGEPVVIYSVGGAVSITITGGIYAGTYTTDYNSTALTTTLIEAGPVCLVLPTISGTTGLGDTLTVQPALWIYEGDDPGSPTFQWQRGGTDITDANDLTHVIVLADESTNVTVEETLGAVTVESAVTAIPSFFSDPTDLGSLLHTWLDFTDASTMWTTTSRTTNVSTDSTEIAYIDDKSSNGNDFSNAVLPSHQSDGGMLYRTAGHAQKTETRGLTNHAVLSALTSTMEVYILMNTGDTAFMLCGVADGFFGVAQSGSGSSPQSGAPGTPTYSEDGNDISSPTRGDLSTNWATSTWVIAAARGVDLSSSFQDDINTMVPGGWTTATLEMAGDIKHVILTEALSSTQRTNLLNWFAAEKP